jgi:hypothetical protein
MAPVRLRCSGTAAGAGGAEGPAGSPDGRLLLMLLALVALWPTAPLAAQSPSFGVEARSSGEGGGAALAVEGILRDRALLSAVESGLPLRFHLRVELWERGFFDRLRGEEERRLVLVQDPIERDFRLDLGTGEHRYPTLSRAQRALEAELRSSLRPGGSGRFYYLASLEIETLSLSDLEELRRWLRGDLRPAVEGRAPPARAVERGLRRVLVRVIGLPTRRYEARSGTFVIP